MTALSLESSAESRGKKADSPFRGHLPALDGVRGLAILLVMVCHYCGQLTSSHVGRLAEVLQTGRYGVDLFFVLSGFLITGILIDTKTKPRYFVNFYGRRSVRIFPLYYAVLTFCFVVLPFLGVGYGTEGAEHAGRAQGGLWLYYSNFVMASQNGWQGDWVYNYPAFNMTHFWSLAVEEHFYLVWPLVVFLLSGRQLRWACVGLIVGAVATRAALLLSGVSPMSVFLLTPCRVDALATGALIASLVRGPTTVEQFRKVARWGVIGFGVLIVVLFVGAKRYDTFLQTTKYLALAFFFGSLLLVAITARPGGVGHRVWTNGGLRFLGKYSYGIYVFHVVFVPVYERYFGPDVLEKQWHVGIFGSVVIYAVLASASSIGIALLSWHLLEKRCLELKKRFE